MSEQKEMKYDGGKPIAGVLYEDFPHAMTAVIEVATFGANKYKRNSWKGVSNNKQRYTDAMHRHLLAEQRGEVYDDESELLHAAHAAWGALARLELIMAVSHPCGARSRTLEEQLETPDFRFHPEGDIGGTIGRRREDAIRKTGGSTL